MDKTYFENAKKQIAEFKKRMADQGKEFFLEQARPLFEKYPRLIKFGWTQYTPYFNDGEACYFSANIGDPMILLEGESEDTFEESPWYSKDDHTEDAEIWRGVREFLEQFDGDNVEMMFGDHVIISVTRDGVEVEEYNHE